MKVIFQFIRFIFSVQEEETTHPQSPMYLGLVG